jgi:hypothetical protein
MASFTVRIVLHGAELSEYEELHKFMEYEGFSRTITDAKANEYHLPPGENTISGPYTRLDVRTKARLAAEKTERSFGVLVTESKGRAWLGLEPVDAPVS